MAASDKPRVFPQKVAGRQVPGGAPPLPECFRVGGSQEVGDVPVLETNQLSPCDLTSGEERRYPSEPAQNQRRSFRSMQARPNDRFLGPHGGVGGISYSPICDKRSLGRRGEGY